MYLARETLVNVWHYKDASLINEITIIYIIFLFQKGSVMNSYYSRNLNSLTLRIIRMLVKVISVYKYAFHFFFFIAHKIYNKS